MGLKEDLEKFAAETHRGAWKTRDGQKIPQTDDIGLGNEAVKLEGTVLYADMADSTGLVKGYKDWFAAEVYKNYLYASSRIVRIWGGTITAFDGDRVMAVFIGDSKEDDATKAGMQISGAVRDILQPAMDTAYPKSSFKLKQKVGIASSALFVARTGIRGSNDLVWVGHAANIAAKMAALSTSYSTYVTKSVYDGLLDPSSKYGGNPQANMWFDLGTSAVGERIYGTTWLRTL